MSSDDEAERLTSFLYLCPVGLAEISNTGEVAMMNSAGAQLLMPVDPTSDLTNLFDALGSVAPELRQIAAQGPRDQGTICEGHRIVVRHAEQESAVLAATLVRIDAGRMMAVLQDVTRTAAQEERLRADQEKFRAIFDGVRDSMICTLDLQGRVDGWNTSGERLLGYTLAEVSGRPLSALSSPDLDAAATSDAPPWLARASVDGWCDIDGWNTRRNGSRFWGDGVVSALRDEHGVISGYSVVLRDMTERRLTVERLQDLATKDPLTGLANRRHFFEQAERELGLAVRHGYPLSILMIDADHFKRINDAHGHPVGDEVLRRLANTLRQHLRTTDLPARYGGEELIVLLPSTAASGAMVLAERYRLAVRGCELAVGDARVTWTISIGLADLRPGERTLDTLIQRADAALYRAKAAGRDRTACASADT